MSRSTRTLTGAGLGVLAASIWMLPVLAERMPLSEAFGKLLGLLLFMGLLTGPGALLLSWIHAAQMGKFARRAGSKAAILTLGTVLGMPLGVANLVLLFFVIGALFRFGLDTLFLTTIFFKLLVPALAGGAGLGLGASLGLEPQSSERRTAPILNSRNIRT